MAHVTDGNVEIIQPLEVTDTHVIIHIQHLSPFSLLKSSLHLDRKKAQILLFYDERIKKLHIHLLQRKVKAKEVICFNDCVVLFLMLSLIHLEILKHLPKCICFEYVMQRFRLGGART